MGQTLEELFPILTGVNEAFQNELVARPPTSEQADGREVPAAAWPGWAALAAALDLPPSDLPEFRARQAAKVARRAELAAARGALSAAGWAAAERQLEAITVGDAGPTQLPDTQPDGGAAAPARAVITLVERSKRGRRSETSYCVLLEGQPPEDGEWFSAQELRRAFPGAWRAMVAEHEAAAAAGAGAGGGGGAPSSEAADAGGAGGAPRPAAIDSTAARIGLAAAPAPAPRPSPGGRPASPRRSNAPALLREASVVGAAPAPGGWRPGGGGGATLSIAARAVERLLGVRPAGGGGTRPLPGGGALPPVPPPARAAAGVGPPPPHPSTVHPLLRAAAEFVWARHLEAAAEAEARAAALTAPGAAPAAAAPTVPQGTWVERRAPAPAAPGARPPPRVVPRAATGYTGAYAPPAEAPSPRPPAAKRAAPEPAAGGAAEASPAAKPPAAKRRRRAAAAAHTTPAAKWASAEAAAAAAEARAAEARAAEKAAIAIAEAAGIKRPPGRPHGSRTRRTEGAEEVAEALAALADPEGTHSAPASESEPEPTPGRPAGWVPPPGVCWRHVLCGKPANHTGRCRTDPLQHAKGAWADGTVAARAPPRGRGRPPGKSAAARSESARKGNATKAANAAARSLAAAAGAGEGEGSAGAAPAPVPCRKWAACGKPEGHAGACRGRPPARWSARAAARADLPPTQAVAADDDDAAMQTASEAATEPEGAPAAAEPAATEPAGDDDGDDDGATDGGVPARDLAPAAWRRATITGAKNVDGEVTLWVTWAPPPGAPAGAPPVSRVFGSAALMGRPHCMESLIRFYESKTRKRRAPPSRA